MKKGKTDTRKGNGNQKSDDGGEWKLTLTIISLPHFCSHLRIQAFYLNLLLTSSP